MLTVTYTGRTFTPAMLKRLQKNAVAFIEERGSVTSASGISAAFAINHLEETKQNYAVEHLAGGGYYVERK